MAPDMIGFLALMLLSVLGPVALMILASVKGYL
jgi:hypothetical protein